MNLTFFLGAGFSAPFGHPVMDSFFGFADSCERLSDDDRSFLGRLILEARRANSFLESSPTNLEDVLSFAEMGERLGLSDQSENRNHHLRQIVQRIYTTVPPADEYWQRCRRLSHLLGSEPKDFKGKLSFVTTNYDLNTESACVALNARANPGFELRRVEQGNFQVTGHLYDRGGIPLYKLHGSVNWYPTDDEPGLTVEDRVVALHGHHLTEREEQLPYPCAGDYKSPGMPEIVAPSFLKPDLRPALKAVWRGAAQALSQANVIVFVGYSFPASDTEMMFFLARALSENAGLRAIYLVDPTADEIASRLRAAGTRVGSHFRSLLRTVASDWTHVRFPPW